MLFFHCCWQSQILFLLLYIKVLKPMNKVDILENDILQRYPDVLAELLRDHTTGRNIFWATYDYEERGEGYAYDSEITIEAITGENDGVIKPRVLKS